MIKRQKSDNEIVDLGLGLFLKNHGNDLTFFHKGQNDGFIALLAGYAFDSKGIVIMMNNDSGWGLIEEIVKYMIGKNVY